MQVKDARARRLGGQRRWALRLLPAFAVTLSLACAACSSGSAPHQAASAAHPAGSAGTFASAQAASSPAAGAASAAPASCPAEVFGRMTEAQRVGQLFLVGIAGAPAAEVAQAVADYHFGSFLFQGTSTAGQATDQQVSAAIQALASAAGTASVRFFIAANQEGGQVQELQGPGFSAIPSALDQGLLSTGDLQRQAAAWGRQLQAAGVNLDLAPVMDVVPTATASQNAPIGALEREFGATPQLTSVHGAAFIRGMQ